MKKPAAANSGLSKMYREKTHQAGKPESAIIPAKQALKKAGAGLSLMLKQQRKADARLLRRKTSFKAIPESVYFELAKLGRAKYRAIVVVSYMALLWDGWTSRKKTKRKPSLEVMITRRILAAHFNMPEATGKRALHDLVKNGTIIVSRKAVYSGKNAKNLGTFYRLPFMEKNSGGKQLKVYWGLLVSDGFLGLSVPAQVIIILLHSLHNRSRNRLTIHPNALTRYGIHRTTLPAHLNELMAAKLLLFVEDFDFEFGWFDSDGKPDFTRLNKNSRVAN